MQSVSSIIYPMAGFMFLFIKVSAVLSLSKAAAGIGKTYSADIIKMHGKTADKKNSDKETAA